MEKTLSTLVPEVPENFEDAEELEEEQDHESEEEVRRRLDEWRCMAANLAGGFTQMPDAVRKDPTLSTSAKLVYEHLLSYMWKKEWCWPSQKRIAAELKISRHTVIRACKILHARCYIDKWRRGLGRTNVYFINPLSFVTATSGRPLTTMRLCRPEGDIVALGSPLQALYTSTFYANDISSLSSPSRKSQDATSGSGNVEQQKVPKSDLKHTKANSISLKEESDSDSSGFAASFDKEEVVSEETCSHIAHGAIRNEECSITSDTVSPSRNSKPSSRSLEIGGAEDAKEVKVITGEEKQSRWQALALAHGISLVQQDALDSYIKTCPRPLHIPVRVEQALDPLSRKYNNIQYLASNRTQATKLWQYAQLKGMDYEYVHDTFQEWVDTASAATVPSFVKNKMAWFFKALRLEVLKALIPYEEIAPVAEESAIESACNDDTTTQEPEELRQEEPETQSINQEEQGALPAITRDELECQEEQFAPEPEYLMTEDPDAGWATWATASHWAERLCDEIRDTHKTDVLPTRFGRWGFYLYEQGQPNLVLEYVKTSAVIERIEEEKQKKRFAPLTVR